MSLLTTNHNLISGTLPPKPFITEWTVPAATTITIPHLSGYIHNYLVDYGDGTPLKHVTAYDSPNASHTYANAGTYVQKIYGTCESFYVNNDAMKSYITKWSKFGDVGMQRPNFYGCSNLSTVPDDGAANSKSCTSFANLFFNCVNITNWGDISYWDTSNVESLLATFYGCVSFNQPLYWDTAKNTHLYYTFYHCSAYNQPVSMDTSKVTTTRSAFEKCSALASLITFSDTSKVADMARMFFGCINFNHPLVIDISSVTNFTQMMYACYNFNNSITLQGIPKSSSMAAMLGNCTSFNQNISSWPISLVSNFTDFMVGVTLSPANYDALLIAWSNLDLVNGLTANFGNSKYTTAGQTAKNSIIADDGWTFIDGGLA